MSAYNLNYKIEIERKFDYPLFIFQIDRYFYLNIQISRRFFFPPIFHIQIHRCLYKVDRQKGNLLISLIKIDKYHRQNKDNLYQISPLLFKQLSLSQLYNIVFFSFFPLLLLLQVSLFQLLRQQQWPFFFTLKGDNKI